MATPPIKWLKARNFSWEKYRSASCPPKNIPVSEARAKALKTHALLIEREVQVVLTEIQIEQRQPRAIDHVFEKHHHRELRTD